jgi:diketogulonate reductase-like aldo/keto reductase
MRHVTLPSGRKMPVLGQGTWHMGENRRRRADEVDALKLGLDLGLNMIDTAEMYGEGSAEEITGEATAGRRDGVYLVSKVYPYNASRKGVIEACERSLRRLKTDRLDLYLLHWRGSHPLKETVAGFESLRQSGKILDWGVSNFDVDDMEEIAALGAGAHCASNQVLYNLATRGIEQALIAWCQSRKVSVMAYTPLEPARLGRNKALAEIAKQVGVPPLTLALAWVIRLPGVVTIPKATAPEHVRDNRAALDLKLDAATLAALDKAFPPPKGRQSLEMR